MHETLIRISPDAVFVADHEGNITEVSPRVMEQFGYGSPEEVLGKNLFDLVAPEYRTKARTSLEDAERGGPVRDMMFRFLRNNGSSFIGVTHAAWADNGSGQPRAIIFWVRDITEKVISDAKIRESEERFRALFEGSMDTIFIADPDTGKILEANPAASDMLLLPEEKIVGMMQWEIHPAALREEEKKRFSEYIKDKVQWNPSETVLLRADERQIPVELLAQIIQLDGIPVLYSTFRDISERMKAETRRKESEFQFRNLAEHSPNMIFINQAGKVVYANRKCEETMGYSREEFLSSDFDFLSLMWGESRDRARENFQRHMMGDELLTTEYSMLTRSGKRFDTLLSSRIIRYQGERAILGIITDITDRKRTETALAESELMYRTLVRTSPDAIIVTDPEGIVTEVSRQTIEQLGYGSPEELTGRNLMELIVAKGRETMQKDLLRVLELGAAKNMEYSLLRKDGMTFLGDMNVSVVKDLHQSPRALIFSIRDITQRRQMETELARVERLDALGVLAGGIAHDFNNILTAISTNISMAQMFGNLEEEISKMLDDAEAASSRAKNLTQQLLTFSKGGLPVKNPIRISRLIKETSEFALSGSNVVCTYDLAENLKTVDADEGQISQVIQNLIINADQAIPGGGTIRILAENTRLEKGETVLAKEGEYIRISITDQGTGIPKKHLNRIFDPFFSTKYKGSGLGLSTVFSIVNNHGGQIQVSSEAGEGTTFTICLPATDKPTEEKKERNAPPARGEGRILIIDDDDMVRRSAGKTLQKLGYSVDFAEEGARGIKIYIAAQEEGAPFDAVIMDVTIPGGMGGLEAISKLLKIDPEARAIVSSGYSNDPAMARFREYGFRGVIKKPYKIEALGDVVARTIRGDGQSADEG